MPTSQPPGRIMIEGQPDPLEVQVALLNADASGPAQVAALRALGEESLRRHGSPAKSIGRRARHPRDRPYAGGRDHGAGRGPVFTALKRDEIGLS